MGRFEIPIRYYPQAVNYEDQYSESEFRPVERNVDFDLKLSCLVIVDAWNTNEIGMDRIDKIINEGIKPVVNACRSTGVLVVHAPGPPVADKYPNLRFRQNPKLQSQQYSYPTQDMCQKTGFFRKYSLRRDPDAPFLSQEKLYKNYIIHPALGPEDIDIVIGDRQEMNEILVERRKFHLFYVGFSSNGCLQERDYGIKGMLSLGYNVILLRDCTTAIEMATTLSSLEQTRASIDNMQLWIATTDSKAFMKGIRSGTE